MASNPDKTDTVNRPYSGVNSASDPSLEPGQYPVTADQHGIFGGPLPDGTGAPGSAGAYPGPSDATNEPGQTLDGITGISENQITESGAPGSQGAVNAEGGADSVTYTEASDGILPYKEVTVNDSVDGTADWTAANTQGYGSGGPQLPGIRGNEPEAGSARYQPGGGRVLRGGRSVRP